MKKYITLAALLAAGTTFANAEEILLTLTTPAGSKLESGNSGFVWSDSSVSSPLDSWKLEFTLTDKSLETGAKYLFGTEKDAKGAAGYVLQTTNGNITFGYKDEAAEITFDSVVEANVGVSIALSFVLDVNEEGVSQESGIFTLKVGESSETYSWSASESGKVVSNTQFEGRDGGTRLWTNGGAETFSGISLTKLDHKVIPEPSAFGMLAGLGALALVASRRRRK